MIEEFGESYDGDSVKDNEELFQKSWELSGDDQLQFDDIETNELEVMGSIENITEILIAEDSSTVSLSLPKSFDDPIFEALPSRFGALQFSPPTRSLNT